MQSHPKIDNIIRKRWTESSDKRDKYIIQYQPIFYPPNLCSCSSLRSWKKSKVKSIACSVGLECSIVPHNHSSNTFGKPKCSPSVRIADSVLSINLSSLSRRTKWQYPSVPTTHWKESTPWRNACAGGCRRLWTSCSVGKLAGAVAERCVGTSN